MLFSYNTKIGPKLTRDHLDDDRFQPKIHKLSPFPIFRKDLLNSSRLRERLQVEGHKVFARLSASGPETSKILFGIQRSQCVKFVKKFEFDPYLCDKSHLNRLRRICHKIKDIKHLDIVFRRVDFSNEIEVFSPSISTFLRLKSLRVEFPGTKNVEEDSLIELYKAIGKCYHLRTFEWKTVGMPEESPRLWQASNDFLRGLKWLECNKNYEVFKKGVIKNQIRNFSKVHPRMQKNALKYLTLTLSSAGEWANGGMMDPELQKGIVKFVTEFFGHLEKFRIHAIKTKVTFEDIFGYLAIAALVQNLYHLEFDLLSCQISDVEMSAFAHGLAIATRLKYFSLKVIQKPGGISEECIEKFAGLLSKLEHLSKFDIYFRRLDVHPQAIQDLGSRIRNFENIKCSCSKESIYIYRRNETE